MIFVFGGIQSTGVTLSFIIYLLLLIFDILSLNYV